MKTDVYAFGSALVDIQIQVTDKLLDEIGAEKGNMYLAERNRQEDLIKKLLGSDNLAVDHIQKKLQTAAGGSAANTVFGIAQLGGRGALCGKVADDSFGDLYTRHMRNSGVLFHKTSVQGMTGTCVVMISDDAQRTMLTCLGVSSEIALDDIDEDLIRQSTYVYLEGYLFDSEVATRTLLRVVEIARKHGVRLSLTASDSFCVSRHKDIFLKLLRDDVDLLFANAQEARALSDTGTTADAIRVLSEMGRNIAVTDGSRGSTLVFDGQTIKIDPCTVSAIDTTGAGDSYAAGLLFGLTNGYSLKNSGNIASFFASRVVSQVGPRYSGSIKNELKSLQLIADN